MVLNLLMSAIDVAHHSAQSHESFLACQHCSVDACEGTWFVVASWHKSWAERSRIAVKLCFCEHGAG
jgi:hypothetical protein